ncbi:MAG TPA: GYD domain-containing protein [Dehalococcoidia bacterium]|nr:GYD domain-containing protein [Dehalococcoidia bacterium]
MPIYLSQFSYTSSAWAAMLRQPQNRADAIRQLLQGMRGRLIGYFGSLGEHDAISIFELPDDTTAATFIGAALTMGMLRETTTTTLVRATDFLTTHDHEIGGEGKTGYCLLQAAYTAEAWAAMVRHPQNRLEAARPVAEKLGGTLENAWLSFGEYDIVVLLRMPDNASLAAFARVMEAGGGVKAVKTTPLLTAEEGMEIMRRAAEAGADYHPPQEDAYA